MPTLRTRSAKGSELTFQELDDNFKRSVVAKTANYTTTLADNRNIIVCSGTITITLLDSSAASNSETGDYSVTIKNIGSGTVTIAISGTDTIEGSASSLTLDAKDSVVLSLNSAGNGYDIISLFDNNVQIQKTEVDLDGKRLIIDGDGDSILQAGSDDILTWTIGGVDRHVFFGQHVGFGTTLIKNWSGSYTAQQMGNQFSVLAALSDAGSNFISRNAWYDGTNWKYIATEQAQQIHMDAGGGFVFNVAPSGIAGNAISWTKALQINNDGSVLVPTPPLDLQGSSPNLRFINPGGSRKGELFLNTSSNYMFLGLYQSDGVTVDSAIYMYPNLLQFTGFNSTANQSVLRLQPTDYGAGKPRFHIAKGSVADKWQVAIYDGSTTNVGTLAFYAGGYEFYNNGVIVGAPTGGNKGLGSLNAQALYENGVRPLLEDNGQVGAAELTTSTIEGSYTVGGTPQVLPSGLYWLWDDATGNSGTEVSIQVWLNGAWRDSHNLTIDNGGIAVFCWANNNHVQLARTAGAGNRTIRYRRIA